MRNQRDERSLGLRRTDKHIDKMRDRLNTLRGQVKSLPDGAKKALSGIHQRESFWTSPAIGVY